LEELAGGEVESANTNVKTVANGVGLALILPEVNQSMPHADAILMSCEFAKVLKNQD